MKLRWNRANLLQRSEQIRLSRLSVSPTDCPLVQNLRILVKKSAVGTYLEIRINALQARFEFNRAHSELMSDQGLVSRASPVHTAMRNCMGDEGGPFEVGNQVLISSHRKLLSSKAMVVNVAETPGHDPGRHG